MPLPKYPFALTRALITAFEGTTKMLGSSQPSQSLLPMVIRRMLVCCWDIPVSRNLMDRVQLVDRIGRTWCSPLG